MGRFYNHKRKTPFLMVMSLMNLFSHPIYSEPHTLMDEESFFFDEDDPIFDTLYSSDENIADNFSVENLEREISLIEKREANRDSALPVKPSPLSEVTVTSSQSLPPPTTIVGELEKRPDQNQMQDDWAFDEDTLNRQARNRIFSPIDIGEETSFYTLEELNKQKNTLLQINETVFNFNPSEHESQNIAENDPLNKEIDQAEPQNRVMIEPSSEKVSHPKPLFLKPQSAGLSTKAAMEESGDAGLVPESQTITRYPGSSCTGAFSSAAFEDSSISSMRFCSKGLSGSAGGVIVEGTEGGAI